jgi:hypothetical protein
MMTSSHATCSHSFFGFFLVMKEDDKLHLLSSSSLEVCTNDKYEQCACSSLF